ncbi:hypothetical protein Pan216_53340 [Planctomycetes bacterium Pan216]|uniref:Class I SAM-dependent methyltransferase n=1 Tax=Kolteria novifilia TaxID=2527975 RepID=A0A518BBT0_9BACT|nr:hypothetical protein Pan216_53340 [Planctomycetes bacterium Pan216]
MATVHPRLTQLVHRVSPLVKTYLPPVHALIRRGVVAWNRRRARQLAASRYEAGLPLLERSHLAALCSHLGLRGEGAEIGVYEGAYSEEFLQFGDLAVLHLIDPWKEFHQDDYSDKINAAQEEMQRRFEFTQDRLRRFGTRCRFHREMSEEAVGRFEDASLDFVYIDANHSYAASRQDIAWWWPKVRPGGIFAGHDYLEGQIEGSDYGVKRAIDEFVAEHDQQLFVIDEPWPSWYLIKRPVSASE